MKEEAGVELPEKMGEMLGEDAMVLQMYKSVKDKAKSEGNSGLAVAIFRLLTLIARCKTIPRVLSDNMEHSILKFAYKMAHP